MGPATVINLHPEVDVPILTVEDINAPHETFREAYEAPGILVVDQALDEDVCARLRLGQTGRERKFGDPFNDGIPKDVRTAYEVACDVVAGWAHRLLGYYHTDKFSNSYRPMISKNEPLHYDTYPVKCGTTMVMGVVNFDSKPRKWQVGLSFEAACRRHPKAVRAAAGTGSVSVHLRAMGLEGKGPLSYKNPYHEIAFAPGAVWLANPKIVSHRLLYGAGCVICAAPTDRPACKCQSCLMKRHKILTP